MEEKIRRLFNSLAEQSRVFRDRYAAEQTQQLSIVIQHLLEMRHQPTGIDAVAGKAAAEMVVDAALAEMGQGGDDGLAVGLVAGAPVEPPEEFEDGGLGEFGGAAEAAMRGVDGLEEKPARRVEPLQAQGDRRLGRRLPLHSAP